MAEPNRAASVAFRRVFLAVASTLIIVAFGVTLWATGDLLAAYLAGGFMVIGTNNGMVWGAYRVQQADGSGDAHG